MFRHFLVICLVLVATALAGYPKARVEYVDPKAYTAEMMCSKGAFETRIKFNGLYRINSFIVSSHVRNYTSGLEGVYEAHIRLTVKDHRHRHGGILKDGAAGYFMGLVPSTTLVDVPMVNDKGRPFVAEPDYDYIIQVWYGGDLTYPMFIDYDLSIGPIASMQTLIVMGVDYE